MKDIEDEETAIVLLLGFEPNRFPASYGVLFHGVDFEDGSVGNNRGKAQCLRARSVDVAVLGVNRTFSLQLVRKATDCTNP